MRKHIYDSPVLEQKNRAISNALDVFLEGISSVFGTAVKTRSTAIRKAQGPDGQE